MPSDGKGFIGRACNSPGCNQYFKIRIPDHKDELYCPYCGTQFHKNELLTQDQHEYLRQAAIEEARVYALQEVQKMFKRACRGSRNITYKPGPRPTKRPVIPNYSERKVDTELECPSCGTQFQVYGIFGYCPGCKYENLQIYDANWAIIKQSIATATDKTRQLRHAYSDLVSTFEAFCQRKAQRLTSDTGNFQVLSDARKFFKKHANIDILALLSQVQLLTLRRVFQKRHVCIHAGGIITARYTKKIPEDSKLLGTEVVLSESELEEAAIAIRIALGQLVLQIERPGK